MTDPYLIVSVPAGSKGRMVHLLKEKSKVHWKHKERKKYKPLKIEKDRSIASRNSDNAQIDGMPAQEFDFSQEMKELNQKGPAAYLAK